MASATATAARGGLAGLDWKAALSYLATGRYAECLEAVGRATRRGEMADKGAVAVVQCDALLGLLRHADAAAAAARALRRGDIDPDTRARLRVSRGQALWLLGRRSPGRAEVLRAAQEATRPLTQARAAEALSLIAWKEQDAAGDARGRLSFAVRLYTEAGFELGVARCLGIEAGVLRDEGRYGEALKVQERRIAVASATTSLEAQAEAHDDRGDLLAYLGRWEEARAELDEAAELFRQIASPRAVTSAPRRAMVSLASGDLGSVRAAVDRSAADAMPGARDLRSLGEHWLLASDLHLASNEGRSAEKAGAEALRLFRLAKDLSGECRARVRRVHALLAEGQRGEAVAEARRAVRFASRGRAGQESLVWLALGRALLHSGSPEAARAFDRSRSTAGPRKWLEAAARLGGALARGAGREDAVVASALKDLERWGDRRLLAYVLTDLQSLRGRPEDRPATPHQAPAAAARPCASAVSFAAAVDALSGQGTWPERWAGAMEALRPVLPWFRAAWVRGDQGVLVNVGSCPTALPKGDVARVVGGGGEASRVYFLPESAARHPVVVIHDLHWAAVAATPCGGRLYIDARRQDRALDGAHVALLDLVARLLVKFEGSIPPPAEHCATFPEIVGQSAAMTGLFAEMARVASSELFVHIFGETGTGKERVARALHLCSPRARGPFVAVNASSLSDELFESELFGHVRGAFTGAIAERRGYVAEAEGGTLFIDEVTDLSSRCQSKLLRFLTDGEYRRLGECETRRADVRLLTAANVRLPERVAAGGFRQDLMFRVNGMTLALPPLRERGDDVLLLARHFLARKSGRKVGLSPDAARALLRYPWPGNVRELENEMDRVAIFAGSGAVCAEHLSTHVREARPIRFRTLDDAVSACERDVIVGALAQHSGNRSRTACALGISRQALLAKIQRYGI